MTTTPHLCPVIHPTRRALLGVALCVTLSPAVMACAGKRTVATKAPTPIPEIKDVRAGDCADPTKQGAFSETPSLRHADRDLDGDDIAELVVADRTLCDAEGNCHWNLYRKDGECHRYLGTVSGALIQRLKPRGEHGFVDLRVWWHHPSGTRFLKQEYRYGRSGYRAFEALNCVQADDDRLLCEEEGR